MDKIDIIINDAWKRYNYRLDDNERELLNKKITFTYDKETTLYDLFKYINELYEQLICDFEKINVKKINYVREIKSRYRLLINQKYIYIYDLNVKVRTLINSFNLNYIEVFFVFFAELGGKILELKGMKFYIHSKEAGKHNIPHIHVSYQNSEVSISLNGEILAGKIDSKKQKIAIQTIVEDKESLLLKWNEITDGEKFYFKHNELVRLL